jgi:hypothetical protein
VTAGIWEMSAEKNYGSNVVLKSPDRVAQKAAVLIFDLETM